MSRESFVSEFYQFAKGKLDGIGKQILVPDDEPQSDSTGVILFNARQQGIWVTNINDTFLLRLWYKIAHDAVYQERNKIIDKAQKTEEWKNLSRPKGKGPGGESTRNVVEWDLQNDIPRLTSWKDLIDNKEKIFNRILAFYRLLREVGIVFEAKE